MLHASPKTSLYSDWLKSQCENRSGIARKYRINQSGIVRIYGHSSLLPGSATPRLHHSQSSPLPGLTTRLALHENKNNSCDSIEAGLTEIIP